MVSTLGIIKIIVLLALAGGLTYFMHKRWIEYNRVLTSTKKPTEREYKSILKIAAIGVAAIGLIGALIQFSSIALG